MGVGIGHIRVMIEDLVLERLPRVVETAKVP